MLKKSFAILLAFCVMLMSSTFFVHAQSTKVCDDFDTTGQVGTINSPSTGSYYQSANGLFVKPNINPNAKHITLETDKGYTGTGLYMKCTASKTSGYKRMATTMTKALTLTETNAFILSYKIKFLTLPETLNSSFNGFSIQLASVVKTSDTAQKSNGGSSAFYVGTDKFNGEKEITVGDWYTITAKVSGAEAAKNLDAYILDENGGVLLTESKTVTCSADETVNFWPVHINDNAFKEEVELVIDDVVLSEYDISNGASFEKSTLNDGEEVGVRPNLTLCFDQTVSATDSTIWFYKTDDSSKKIEAEITQKTFDSLIITPLDDLAASENYTLDFSGVKNSNGVLLSAESKNKIQFKTIDPSIAPVNFESATLLNGTTLTEGMKEVGTGEKFQLNFDTELNVPAEGAVTLTDIVNSKSIAVTAEKNGKSVLVTPSETLCLNTNYTLDFSGITSSSGGKLNGVSSISFTTCEKRDLLYYEENFENAVSGTAVINHSNNILENGKLSYSNIKIKEGVGYGGSLGAEVDITAKADTMLFTNALDFDPSETLFLEYKINISETVGSAKAIWIGAATSPSYGNNIMMITKSESKGWQMASGSGGSAASGFTAGKWHTVLIKITKDNQTGYIFDDSGNQLYTSTRSTATKMPVTLYAFCVTKAIAANGDVNIKTDDFKVYRLSSHKLKLDAARSEVFNGKTEVTPKKSVLLTFNQPLATGAEKTVKMYQGENSLSAQTTRISGNQLLVTSDTSLAGNTEYSIDISGVTSFLGNSLESTEKITFTTKRIYPVNILDSSLNIQNGKVSAGNVTLSIENTDTAIENAVVIVAVKNTERPQKLIGTEIFRNISIEEKADEVLLELKKSYEDVGSVEILLLDSLQLRKPYSFAFKVLR